MVVFLILIAYCVEVAAPSLSKFGECESEPQPIGIVVCEVGMIRCYLLAAPRHTRLGFIIAVIPGGGYRLRLRRCIDPFVRHGIESHTRFGVITANAKSCNILCLRVNRYSERIEIAAQGFPLLNVLVGISNWHDCKHSVAAYASSGVGYHIHVSKFIYQLGAVRHIVHVEGY